MSPTTPSSFDSHPLGRPLLSVFFYNHGDLVLDVLAGIPRDPPFDVVLCDDGSTDDTFRHLESSGHPVLRHERNLGIGASIKHAISYARERGYKVLVIMAGNGKDDAGQVDRLLDPIYDSGYDYVQGSRRQVGASGETVPLFRRLAVPLHALFLTVLTGVRQTDAMNGFRAYRLSLLYDDTRIDAWQGWLDRYEFETYFHYKVLTLGYRFKEVPVTKSYAHFRPGQKYSHIRPFLDWWSILRPLVLLRLGLRR